MRASPCWSVKVAHGNRCICELMHLKISSSGAATHWAYRLGGAVFFTWQSLLVVSQCGDSGWCLSELLISSTSVPSQIIIMRSNYHYIITA